MKKTLTALTLVCLMVSALFCSCSSRPKPEETVRKLETSFNNYDMETMLECYEPSIQDMYAGMMELGGALLGGIDVRTILQGMGGLTNLFGDSMIEGGMPQISITINSIEEVEKDKVLADLTFNYILSDEIKANMPSGTSTEQQMYAYLIYIEDAWYFAAEVPNVQKED